MTIPSASTELAYALVQLAAEAILPNNYSGPIDYWWLTAGNQRTSKFTLEQAKEFASLWDIVEHQSDTTTGFSGTLFRYKGPNDLANGLKTGDLVMSFRSTEFVDDAVRDNQATNKLEIAEFGWAFGQIDDMRRWVDSLISRGKLALAGEPLTVTGYSLGGHLATAFNMLYPSTSKATYTFNGAGVGRVNNGIAGLTAVLNQFRTLRDATADLSSYFSDPLARSAYQSLRSLVNGALPTASQQTTIDLLAADLSSDAILLRTAFNRMKAIQAEAARIQNFSSGDGSAGITNIAPDLVEATNINYQIAVVAGNQTSSISLPINGYQTFYGRIQGDFTYANF